MQRSIIPIFSLVTRQPVMGLVGKAPALAPAAMKRMSSSAAAAAAEQEPELKPRKIVDSTSFVMNMFNGEIRGEALFPYPDVLNEEQKETLTLVRQAAGRLYENYDALKCDENSQIDPQTWEALKEVGAFGMQVPVDYGGAGFNNSQYARLAELLGATDLGLSIALGSHQSIGYKGILLYGTDAQKAKYLPDLAAGNKIACYCLTEPGSGSDAGSIKTRAELSPDGKHYILNGNKIWISNGGIADIFTVFAKTPVTDEKTGQVKDKITAFIVERDFGGITHGPPEKKMGIKASNTAEVHFENVPIPVENVLDQPGKGFYVAMNILNSGRFGMGAALSGTMREAIKRTVDHASQRSQFGNKLITYGGIQEKIARMSLLHYTTESMAYAVSGIMDRGFTEYQLESAISKVYASEAAWNVLDETIQIHGGMGFMRETGLEKVMRDLRIFRIFEGANDILRLFVALTGLQYAGGHLKELQRAISKPIGNLGMILEYVNKRTKRSLGLSTGPQLTEFVTHPALRDSAILASKSISNFAAASEELLMKYNKNIIHQQFLLNRLANSAIDIFSMACTLSRVQRSLSLNLPSADHETRLVNLICSEAAERVSVNLGTIRSSDKMNNFELMKQISAQVAQTGGVSHSHPLGDD